MTIFRPSTPRGYTTQDLRDLWAYLNLWRKNASLRPYSYGFLSELARDADATPGEAIDISKTTVYAVMHGAYTAGTAEAIRQRLADCITAKLEDMRTCFPDSRPSSAPALKSGQSAPPLKSKPRVRRTPVIIRRRCSLQGYITWRGNTYYLGSAFAGSICTISPLRDRAHGIRAASAMHSRNAHPVDATNNQLGYEVTP